jgi:hypothetical protein
VAWGSARRIRDSGAGSASYLSTSSVSEAEISDSDDDDLPSVGKIIARSRSIINLTLDGDDDSASDKNTIEVSWLRITRHSVTLILPFDRPRPTYRLTPLTSHHPHYKSHPHIPPTIIQRRLQRPHLLGRYFLGRMSLRGRPCITNSNCILPRLFIYIH